MAASSPQSTPGSNLDLKTWIAAWPAVRREVEERLAQHVQQDPSLHFELTLIELELKDIDEAIRRMAALDNILSGDGLSAAEDQATGM